MHQIIIKDKYRTHIMQVFVHDLEEAEEVKAHIQNHHNTYYVAELFDACAMSVDQAKVIIDDILQKYKK